MKKTLLIIVALFIFTGSAAFAQPATQYNLLEPIPGYINGPQSNAGNYLQGTFKLAIGIATGLAVIMIIFGGIKYMSTDAFSGKSEARGTIENAIWGLLLAIGAWMILFTINPELVSLNLSLTNNPIPLDANKPTPGGGLGGGGNLPPVCNGCVQVTVPHKEAPEGCAAPGPCYVEPSLNTSLASLNSSLISKVGGLEVTESYPPTLQHQNSCHQQGTCVDANYQNRNLADNPVNIKTFIDEANKAGLKAVFEVKTTTKAQQLISAGVPSANIDVVSSINREHFSVYKK